MMAEGMNGQDRVRSNTGVKSSLKFATTITGETSA